MNKIVTLGTHRGLFSHIFQIISHYNNNSDNLYYALFTNSLYSNTQHENMWDYYFEQPFTIIPTTNYAVSDWFCGYNIPQYPTDVERAKINSIIKNNLKFKPEIIEKFKLHKSTFPTKYLSVQKRGTDQAHGIKKPLESYFEEIDKHIDLYDYLYVATDENLTIKDMKTRYGNKVIYPDIIRSDDRITSIHFGKGLQNPKQMGEEALFESLMLADSDLMIKVLSGVNHFSLYYNLDLKYIPIDLDVEYK